MWCFYSSGTHTHTHLYPRWFIWAQFLLCYRGFRDYLRVVSLNYTSRKHLPSSPGVPRSSLNVLVSFNLSSHKPAECLLSLVSSPKMQHHHTVLLLSGCFTAQANKQTSNGLVSECRKRTVLGFDLLTPCRETPTSAQQDVTTTGGFMS